MRYANSPKSRPGESAAAAVVGFLIAALLIGVLSVALYSFIGWMWIDWIGHHDLSFREAVAVGGLLTLVCTRFDSNKS